MKQLIKGLMEMTPYQIVRRQGPKRNYSQDDYDAIAHNSMENMDKLFADDEFLAGYFNAARERLHRATLKLIEEARPAKGQGVVGDFGCGPGDFFTVMAPAYPGYSFYGYDRSEAALAAARQRYPAGQFQSFDIYTPAPRRHDITICSQTIEHLQEPEIALQTLIGATKPGGVLIITVPNGRTDTFRGHINFWSPESWQFWLKRNVSQPFKVSKIDKGTSGGANLAAMIEMPG
ncbi:MAG TPA: class I SAM-dependent methyltransferase [Reyranella sp.]|nr:class I SAM-dependent methyltransferase [Reyranella sp.]